MLEVKTITHFHMNIILLYRVERWLFEQHIPVLPKIVQLLIFLIFNSKITADSKIGKGTYCVCKGISTVLIPGTEIGENCVLGLRFSTVRQFPYKEVPHLKNNVWVGPNVIILKSATTRLYDTEAKIICIVSKKGAQCIECHHKDI